MTEKKDYTKLFIVWVYALFWISLLISGGLMFVFGEEIPMQLFYIIGSWTPTLALLIMFKKLIPDTSRRDYFKKLFQPRINWGMLLTVTVIQLFIAFGSIFIVSFKKGVSVLTLSNLSIPMLFYAFLISLITGATGEEAAWRGYLFPIMAKKSGVIKGSILLGLIWGFWHTPLWFVTSGFTGLDLVVYIVLFILLICAVSVIIGVCYSHNQNLIVPMWIHLLVNFSASFYAGEAKYALNITTYLTILYVFTALVFSLWYKKRGDIN